MLLPPVLPSPQLLPPPPGPSAPPAPSAPRAPVVPQTNVPPAGPLTPADIQSIRARRSELSSQLTSATGRRDELAQQIENAEGVNKTGLEQRLAVLDNRIIQLESDIAETGRLLTSPQYTSGTKPAFANNFGMSSHQVTGVSIVFTLFVLAPIALAYARSIWKRATRGAAGLPDPSEITRRMTNMEHSIDAIALEIERVSEGQRYVTKLFTEDRGIHALNAGQAPAEPIRVNQAERVGIPHNER